MNYYWHFLLIPEILTILLILGKAGVEIGDPIIHVFNGQEVEVWPRIVWKPKWALTFSDVKRKIGGNCSISQRSTMVSKGCNVIYSSRDFPRWSSFCGFY